MPQPMSRNAKNQKILSEPMSAELFQPEIDSTDFSPSMIQSKSSLDLVRDFIDQKIERTKVDYQTIESDIEGNRVLDEKPPKDNFQNFRFFRFYPKKTLLASFRKPSKRNAFLLITLYRSGSTLTGEMFNRNFDFLYFFEPLGKVEHHSVGVTCKIMYYETLVKINGTYTSSDAFSRKKTNAQFCADFRVESI